jgi:ParB-like chromosome segregation protein Spo0J
MSRRPASTSRTTPKVQPGRDLQVEAHLTRCGFTWNFHAGVALTEFDAELSLRNQARLHKPIESDTVNRYQTALENGDVFPGIVAAETPASRGLLIADGNHRYEAHRQAGKTVMDAYVIVGASVSAITMLTFEANVTHGLPTRVEDRIPQGLYLIENGITTDEAARRLGVKPSVLRTALQLQQANRRAEDSGVNLVRFDRLPQGARGRLSQIMTDEGFLAMVELAMDANLSSEQIQDAVRNINALRSSAKQVQYVRTLRGTYADALQTGGATTDRPVRGRQFRSGRQALSMTLGQLTALPTPGAITERMTPEERPEWVARTEAGIAQLQAILEELQK